MTIGEFSSRCGLSPKVLRSYAEVGVLVPAVVDPHSGYRYYEAGQLEQAETVRLLRSAGMSLADIGRFLSAPSADAVDGWERALTAETFSRRQALGEVRRRLGPGPSRTRGAMVIDVRPVRDRGELANLFDLLGAQFLDPLGHERQAIRRPRRPLPGRPIANDGGLRRCGAGGRCVGVPPRRRNG